MSAVLSECGKYRYRLERDIGAMFGGPVYAFFGINPSTADAETDDATVRKWKGFVTRWRGSRFIVGNVFAYRATDVKELAKVTAPIGPQNDSHLFNICEEADILVPCWGNRGKLPKHLQRHLDFTLSYIGGHGKPVMTFGLSKSGDPLHPLMLGYDTPLRSLKPTEGGNG